MWHSAIDLTDSPPLLIHSKHMLVSRGLSRNFLVCPIVFSSAWTRSNGLSLCFIIFVYFTCREIVAIREITLSVTLVRTTANRGDSCERSTNFIEGFVDLKFPDGFCGKQLRPYIHKWVGGKNTVLEVDLIEGLSNFHSSHILFRQDLPTKSCRRKLRTSRKCAKPSTKLVGVLGRNSETFIHVFVFCAEKRDKLLTCIIDFQSSVHYCFLSTISVYVCCLLVRLENYSSTALLVTVPVSIRPNHVSLSAYFVVKTPTISLTCE